MKIGLGCIAAATAWFMNDIGNVATTMALSRVAIGRKSSFAALRRSTKIQMVSDLKHAELQHSSTAVPSNKSSLLNVARRLRKDHGLCLVDSIAKQQLKAAVQALESECTPPSLTWTETMSGDWDLVCTTVSKVDDYDSRDKLLQVSNPYLTVTQRVMSSAPMVNGHDGTVESSPPPSSTSSIQRIDHVLEYRPPSTISNALDNLPEQSRVVLVHQAKVASSTDASSNNNANESFTIHLRLESIVLEMAGTSTVLDPFGPDVQRRMHLPIAEFGSTGSFITTYIDDDLRISRDLHGSVHPLRIFVRSKN